MATTGGGDVRDFEPTQCDRSRVCLEVVWRGMPRTRRRDGRRVAVWNTQIMRLVSIDGH